MFGLKSTSAVIAEIHNEFDTAGQKAVKEAKSLIALNKEGSVNRKLDKLKEKGFTRIPLAQGSFYGINYDKKCERMKIVENYQQLYPNYKFIFHDQVIAICEKYNLMLCPASMYIRDIPTKNIEEICAFTVRPEHDFSFIYPQRGVSTFTDYDLTYPNNFVPTISVYEELARMNRTSSISYTSKPACMFICAPPKDIATEGSIKKKGRLVFRQIPDPIVLHYVKDGFLIVTKWGLEGNDKNLVNEKMN